jgi:CelD/BcsL family acetyltransferase involved in cellulose biosynthesis
VRLSGNDITPDIGDTLRQLSAASWKQNTGTTFDNSAPSAFLDTLIEHGRREGWLVVWLLTLDDRTIASELHVEYGGRAHALRADYAEDAAELSPGSYLNWKIIERLFDSDLYRYELGPGSNPYKQRWTEHGIAMATLNAWPPTMRGRMSACWHLQLRPALAGIKQRIRTLTRT